MTHLDDEQLSALIDGEGGDEEAADDVAHLADCADCTARLAAFRAVHAAVAVTPEPDRYRRDQAVGRALQELPAQLPAPGPTPLRGRHRQPPRWLPTAAAAAVVLAVLIGGGVVVSQRGSSSTASKASSSAGTRPAFNPTLPAAGGDSSAASGPAAAGLGPIATPEALAAALRAHQPGQPTSAPVTPENGPLASSAGCAAAAATAAGVAAGTPPDYQAPLVYAGTPATVFAFGRAGAGHAAVEAGSGRGCRTLVGVAY